MKDKKGNIKLNYEYRDAANYKNFDSVVFANPNCLSILSELEDQIRPFLLDNEFFDADKLSIPSLHFEKWIPDLDHDWHCFDSLEFTDELPTDERSIESFLGEIKEFANSANSCL